MTVPVTPRRMPAQAGDGVNLDFDFDFLVFEDTDVRVVVFDEATSTEIEAVLDTDYTVTRNADQDTSPGGTINFVVAPAADQTVTIVGGMPYSQPVSIPDGGAFRSQNIEQALDVLAILTQQLKEEIDRCVKTPVSGGDAEALVESINVLAANAAGLAALAENIDDVIAVAAIQGEITAAAANLAAIIAAPAAAAAAAQSALDAQTALATVTGQSKVINGKMEIAQRGATFAAVVPGSYTLDQWSINGAFGTAVMTVSQQTDAPGNNFQNSLRAAVTTADTAIAAGESASFTQPIEGWSIRDLIGQTFTIGFWARSSKTGVHCVALRNSGTDRSYVAEFTINVANTWEKKTITVAGGLPVAGTWNYTNGVGLYLSFAIAVGSTFHTTPGAWQTGNFLSTANQVNGLDTIGNIFALTGVSLVLGAVDLPFGHRFIGDEIARAKRYYRTGTMSLSGYMTAGNTTGVGVDFELPMRTTPTVAFSGNSSTGMSGSPAAGDVTASGFSLTWLKDGAAAPFSWKTTYAAAAPL